MSSPASLFCRRSLPVPPALLLACLAVGGCDPSQASRRPLADDFPEQAPAVLGRGAPIEATPRGFSAILDAGVPARPSGGITLPPSGDRPIEVSPRRGGHVTVREIGLDGPGEIEDRAVVYRGAGRASYWSLTAAGAEEWLLLEPSAVEPGRPAVIWEVAGATPVSYGSVVRLHSDGGEHLLTVTAPAGFLADGTSAPVSLSVRGATIELHVETRGLRALVDPAWTFAASLSIPRHSHTARRLTSGNVLVAGGVTDVLPVAIPGWGSLVVSASAEMYDPVQDEWQFAPDMFVDRVEHAMAGQPGLQPPDGGALVMGGVTDSGFFLSDAEIFDGQSWIGTAPLFEARAGHTATRLSDDRVVVAGGYNDGGGGSSASAIGWGQNGVGSNFLCSTEVFDPSAASGMGDWIASGSLSDCRASHTETLMPGDAVLVTGGEGFFGVLSSVERWSPMTGIWSSGPPMSTPRAGHAAVRLKNGNVLVVGGHDGQNDLASAEILDTAAGTWTAAGAMATGRSKPTATLLNDGRVLVVGGYDNGVPLGSAEIFDPVTSAFSPTVPLVEPRALCSATLLANGDVLVAGGEIAVGNPPITASVEGYSLLGGTGKPCGVAADCPTGFCTDGVCCDAACDQPCEACTAAARGGAGADGECGPVVKGMDPAGDCDAMPASTCGTTGECDGAGACAIHAPGVVCQPGSCMETVATPPALCDGAGTCVMDQDIECAPYACVPGGACTDVCKAPADCAPTGYCDAGGACKPKLPDGAPSIDPAQCLSGFSIDGVCCAEACDQECHTCAKDLGAVADGVCTPYSNVQCDDGTACTALDVCQNGVCVGMQPVNCPGDTGCGGGLACDPATGQCSVALPPKDPGDPCDDGDVCTSGDTCDAAIQCAGTPVVCTPSECQSGGQCVEGVGCQFDPLPDFTACSMDDNPCTAEVCQAGLCVLNNYLDGVPCPGGTCFAGGCIPDGGGTEPSGGAGAGGDPAGGAGGAGGAGTGASGPAGSGGSGTGGSGAAAADDGGYTLFGGACAIPAGGSPGAPGLAGAALALLGLSIRRRRRP